MNDPQRKRLHELMVGTEFFTADYYDAFGQRLALLLNQEFSVLLGHVLLDVLEEGGISPDDIDGIGAKMPLSALMASSITHAASSRGQSLNAFGYVAPHVFEHEIVTNTASSFDLTGSSVVLLISRHDKPEDVMKVIEGLENSGTQVKALLSLISHSQHDIETFESVSLTYLYVF
ncbi:hypothetical protein HCQ94_00465 [Actinomyces sp. zg-332]|uniref:hypothetical protein n=1 Tax=Actinomyces sp. zg-332 TaxID=2708340 RepID=UPI0014242133|nr:hypothetical protein [Actinomyces sp. zg-332]QPK94227.1 hypothetical protein HCQ94_00465 [Actinomyces sp. zg-332]